MLMMFPFLTKYQKVEEIGKGGMGVVYKAYNPVLDRVEAIKCLPPQYMEKEEYRKRLVGEARMISRLSHPSIVKIYDADFYENQFFIVMEFLEGQTLGDRMKEGEIPIEDILDIAIKICEALSVAHDANIIHRDIKPDNIMLGPNGSVKLFDFNLAKATEAFQQINLSITHFSFAKTSEPKIIGTLPYMSPEQIQGKEERFDSRSDIFSLGIVLYEMAWGRRPFQGDTFIEISQSISTKDPSPIRRTDRKLPLKFERAIFRMLAKDPSNRYQNVDEILVEIKQCQFNLGKPAWILEPLERMGFLALQRITPEIKKILFVQVLLLSIVLSGLFGVIYLFGKNMGLFSSFSPSSKGKTDPIANVNWEHTQMTRWNGLEEQPNISPDGKKITFMSDHGGNPDIWVLDLDSRELYPITQSSATELKPIWSFDGRRIYFLSNGRNGIQFDICYVDLQSKEVQLFYEDAMDFSFALNGERGVFTKILNNQTRIFAIDLPTLQNYSITPANDGDKESHVLPTISPKGDRVVYQSGDFFQRSPVQNLWLNDLSLGQIRRLTQGMWNDAYPAWDMDGTWIYFISNRSGKKEIWRILADGGLEAKQLTSGAIEFNSIAVERDKIYYSTYMKIGDIYVSDLENGSEVQLTRGSYQKVNPSWSPDGSSIVFASDQTGVSFDLWKLEFNVGKLSGNLVQLTHLPEQESQPVYSPDGQWIAFVAEKEGNSDLWVVSLDGKEIHPLVSSPDQELWPSWSPDGRYLLFSREQNQIFNIWQIEILPQMLPGKETQLTDVNRHNVLPLWSPDGSKIAYTEKTTGSIWLLENGHKRRLTRPDLRIEVVATSWTKAGLWGFCAGEVFKICNIDLDSGDITILDQPSFTIAQYPVYPKFSPQNQRLIYVRNYEEGDIWRMTLISPLK